MSSSAPAQIAVGVLGLDAAGTAWLDQLQSRSDVRLVGVADADAGRTATVAAQTGTTAFASVADLARATDAVLVASSAATRAHDATTVLEFGAHALVQWPPAPALAEAERLVARADESGARILCARPLPVGPLVAGVPRDWSARLVHLDLSGSPAAASASWTRRLAGALDLCLALVDSSTVARIGAEADRRGGRIRSGLVALRFASGAYAHIALRDGIRGLAPSLTLDASGERGRIAATSIEGPLCLEIDGSRTDASPSADTGALDAFVATLRGSTRAPGALLLDEALPVLRLVEKVLQRLR